MQNVADMLKCTGGCDVGSTVQFLKLALVYLIKLFPETVGEAKAKFHCLQTYFNKEWAKVTTKISGQGTEDNYVSKWEFFEDMKFLKKSQTPQASVSCLEEQTVEVCSTLPNKLETLPYT